MMEAILWGENFSTTGFARVYDVEGTYLGREINVIVFQAGVVREVILGSLFYGENNLKFRTCRILRKTKIRTSEFL